MQKEKRETEDKMVREYHSLNNLSKLWRQWRTEKAGVLQLIGSQRLGHNLETEQQIDLK